MMDVLLGILAGFGVAAAVILGVVLAAAMDEIKNKRDE